MAANLERLQQQIQTEIEKFKTIQNGKIIFKSAFGHFAFFRCKKVIVMLALLDFQKSALARQQLDVQLTENNVVKEVCESCLLAIFYIVFSSSNDI